MQRGKNWRRLLAPVSGACVTGLMLIMWLDVMVEDSGNYTCEIRGPMSMALAHVSHQLYVRGKPLALGIVVRSRSAMFYVKVVLF